MSHELLWGTKEVEKIRFNVGTEETEMSYCVFLDYLEMVGPSGGVGGGGGGISQAPQQGQNK